MDIGGTASVPLNFGYVAGFFQGAAESRECLVDRPGVADAAQD